LISEGAKSVLDFSLTELCIEDKSTIREENDSLSFDFSKPQSNRSLRNRPYRDLTIIYNTMR